MMPRIFLCLAFTVMTFSACSGRIEEQVEYDVYRLPVAGFNNMTFLGIARSKDLPVKHTEQLRSSIQDCGQYQKVNRLDKIFTIMNGERNAVVRKLKSDINGFQESRYVHGVLIVEPIHYKVTREKATVTPVALKENLDHDWYDSYGYAVDPRHPLFAVEEIGPRFRFSGQRAGQRITKFDISLRYLLYNKNLNQVLIDKKTSIRANLATFSVNPAVNEKNFEQELLHQLMERIARQVCPKVTTVERTLLASRGLSKADQMTAAGVKLVDSDGNWEGAADMWKKAILLDKAATYAYHNLGIYYERAGNIPSAMEEFSKARRTNSSQYREKQYDTSLAIFRPTYDPLALEPRVYASSGANWVSIMGGKKNALVVGREYSIYQLRHVAGESAEAPFDGLDLVEAGRVRIVKQEPPFAMGRVVRFLEGAPIEAGAIVVTAPSR